MKRLTEKQIRRLEKKQIQLVREAEKKERELRQKTAKRGLQSGEKNL